MATELRESLYITMAEAEDAIMDIFKAKLVPNLVSPPGVGKSAMGLQISEKQNLHFIDIRLTSYDPADMNGFPFILNPDTPDRSKVRAGYVPMNTFPIVGDEIPEGKRGFMVMLDEFPSAPLAVQAASYKVVLDKQVGMHHLHPKTVLMTAGNRIEDKAIVNPLSTAMQSRIVTLVIKVSDKAWHRWANTHDIDHRVKSFLKFQPELLHNFDPNHQEVTFPCPRTWEFLSRIIQPWENIPVHKLPVMAGTVGEGAARQFFSYTEVYDHIPTIEQILEDPTGCRLGEEPSMHYALMGLISHHMNEHNADKLINFLTRMDVDFQAVSIRAGIAKDRGIRKTSAYKKWISYNADEMME